MSDFASEVAEIAAQYPVEWRSWHDKTVMPEGGEAREASVARRA